VRVYTPAGKGPFNILVFIHGGGWVCCDLDTHDEVARFLCQQAACVVVSVDYRRAPEYKFPAGLEDVLAVLQWTFSHTAELHGEGQKVAIGGDSAGGNLSLAATLMARDTGLQLPVFMLLLYPVADISSFDTQSHKKYAEGFFLTRTQLDWFKGHYLKSEGDSRNPYVSPLRARNRQGLPPAYIMTAEFDPLRDEAEALAEKMHKAGIPVACTRYNGAVHAFVAMAGAVKIGREALKEAAGELKKAFKNY
jgi:acetyl esterase